MMKHSKIFSGVLVFVGLTLVLILGAITGSPADDLDFFVEAVRNDRIDEVRALISKGVDANSRDVFGDNAGLHWAASLGLAEMARLLIDSGAGTMRRLLESGITIFDLSHIFYSHFHPDHSGELVPLLFATKYPDSRRRRSPLTICAGAGFVQFFKGLKKVYGPWIMLDPGMLSILELDTSGPDAVRFDDRSFRFGIANGITNADRIGQGILGCHADFAAESLPEGLIERIGPFCLCGG